MIEYKKVPDAPMTFDQILQLISKAEQGDQIYESSVYGAFNAGLFERLYKKFPDRFILVNSVLPESLYKYILDNIQIVPKVLGAMTLDRVAEPVYAVTLDDDEPTFLIDGHHRIVKRWQMGLRNLPVLIGDRWVTEQVHVVKGPLK